MEPKVVFLDIDGTLLDFDGKVPESAKEAVRRAKANGHKMVLCTGRSKFQIPKELFGLGIDGVISGAGAYVEARKPAAGERAEARISAADGSDEVTVLLRSTIDEAHAKSSYEYLEGNGFLYCYQAEDGIVLNRRSFEGMFRIDQLCGLSEEMMESLHGVIHHTETPWDFPNLEKIVFYEAPFSLEKIREDLLPYFDTVTLSLNGAKGVAGEIGLGNIHKATGMRLFLDYIGVNPADSIAIGDGPNDLQMMDFAGIGVAMGNACAEVKARADMVTDSVSEDGICHAFEKIGLL